MGLGDQELKAFLGTDGEEPGFEAITVLLAIVTGFPKVASDFVEKIKQGKEGQSIKALANEILKSKITTMNSELKTLADSIKKIDAKLAKVNLGRLKKEIEKIERFSFYGGQNQKDPSLPTE